MAHKSKKRKTPKTQLNTIVQLKPKQGYWLSNSLTKSSNSMQQKKRMPRNKSAIKDTSKEASILQIKLGDIKTK
jgi:hypothetical protein